MRKKNTSIKVVHYIEVALKWRWLIIIPFCIAMVVGTYLAFTLPAIYEASTLILIEPQAVPDDYVRSIVTSDINARISAISHQILSRTNLEKVIRDFGLFASPEYLDMAPEDKISDLRESIDVKISRQRRATDAFTIAFRGKVPETVMRVANGLGSYSCFAP